MTSIYLADCSVFQMPILMIPSSHDPLNPSKAGAQPVVSSTLGELLPMSFGPGVFPSLYHGSAMVNPILTEELERPRQ